MAELLTGGGDDEASISPSRNLLHVAKSIKDVLLIIPRKIVTVIQRIAYAVYAYWLLVFRTIYRFISGIFNTIGNTGGGIVNFYRELFSIFVGIFVQ